MSLFRQICGWKRDLAAAKRRDPLESCPQQAASRMGLKLVAEADCCGQLSLPGADG
jgi:hypothetical protein